MNILRLGLLILSPFLLATMSATGCDCSERVVEGYVVLSTDLVEHAVDSNYDDDECTASQRHENTPHESSENRRVHCEDWLTLDFYPLTKREDTNDMEIDATEEIDFDSIERSERGRGYNLARLRHSESSPSEVFIDIDPDALEEACGLDDAEPTGTITRLDQSKTGDISAGSVYEIEFEHGCIFGHLLYYL